jgi:hypothetical protein
LATTDPRCHRTWRNASHALRIDDAERALAQLELDRLRRTALGRAATRRIILRAA